ncbi:MAG: hypothetical protein QG657_1231, partial [Acidobacteriota bacterium]|nr:hypothetical protein [Acidobacteriota bacterium]
FWTFVLLFTIVLYIMFYFVPSIEGINHRKRELIDMNFKIENSRETEKTFVFPDEKEIKFLAAADAEMKNRVPALKSKEGLISFFTRVTDDIKKRARGDGIKNLRVSDNRDKPGVSGSTGAHVNLSFSGSVKNVLNFINHLSWSNYNLGPDSITAIVVGNSVYYSVVLKVYTAAGKTEPGGIQGQDIMIDFGSPVLLKRVYENPLEAYIRQELSPRYGVGIFQ